MWREMVERNKFHSILFDELPDLKGITICGLGSNRAVTELFFDLSTPIDHLPRKWEQQGFTAVRERMVFFDYNRLSMRLDCPFPVVDAEIQELDKNGVRFTAHGLDADLEIIANDVILQRPIGVRFAGDHFTVS